MLNIDDFIKRLETILDFYGLNASSFADKINVQRSSMSHLLSGRNKPSLDFIMKIIEVFPEVDLYWLLNNVGEFPKKTQKTENDNVDKNSEKVKFHSPPSYDENVISHDLFSKINLEENEKGKNLTPEKFPEPNNSEFMKKEDEIEKIVFFYKNGTFRVYIP